MPIKELLFDSALLLHGAALAAVQMASMSAGFPAKNVDTALRAVEACREIFMTLAEHSDTNRLSTIASNVFQDNLERIMAYIARKGGKVYRYELLTSRVIQATLSTMTNTLPPLLMRGTFQKPTPAGGRKPHIF